MRVIYGIAYTRPEMAVRLVAPPPPTPRERVLAFFRAIPDAILMALYPIAPLMPIIGAVLGRYLAERFFQ